MPVDDAIRVRETTKMLEGELSLKERA